MRVLRISYEECRRRIGSDLMGTKESGVVDSDSNRSRSRQPARILVIFPGALGDLICIVPALREIARRHSCATLELMARAELARFATGRLGIGRGHSIDRREVAQLFTAGAESIRI